MIRFIIDTIASKPDSYGNTYLYSWIKSTKSGKSIATLSDGSFNVANNIIALLDLNWLNVHATYSEIPIKIWKRKAKEIKLMERDMTKEMLLNLEK